MLQICSLSHNLVSSITSFTLSLYEVEWKSRSIRDFIKSHSNWKEKMKQIGKQGSNPSHLSILWSSAWFDPSPLSFFPFSFDLWPWFLFPLFLFPDFHQSERETEINFSCQESLILSFNLFSSRDFASSFDPFFHSFIVLRIRKDWENLITARIIVNPILIKRINQMLWDKLELCERNQQKKI
jgi:hypothetical protein